ncbi:hypothetical protein CRYUN_Cryun11dG0042100 [Craigia yunnanensis]
MGSGDWFRSIICGKKSKSSRSKQAKVHSANEKSNGGVGDHDSAEAQLLAVRQAVLVFLDCQLKREVLLEFRRLFGHTGYNHIRGVVDTVGSITGKARKAVRRLRDTGKFNILIQGHTVKKQTSSTLSYLHSWCSVQSQIRSRRICMVTEGRIKQKKMENQLKLEAKLHELEVEWCGGSDAMEEILSRIQQKEAAAIKRERAMAYAFSHQWRANASRYIGQASFGLGKENWGSSWMERWIAARPWEVRVHSLAIHPRKTHARQASKSEKEMKVPALVKPALPNGTVAPKVKKVAPTDG